MTAAVALAVAACSSSSTTTADGGTITPTDSGANKDGGGNDCGGNPQDGGGGGNDSSTGDDGGSCTLAIGTGDAACDACLGAHCCDKLNACANDTGCVGIIDCIGACNDPDANIADAGGCTSACVDNASTASKALYADQATCGSDNCANADGGSTACAAFFN